MEGSMPPHHESGQVSDYFNQEIMPEVTLCDFVDGSEKALLLPVGSVGKLTVEEISCQRSLTDATMPVRHREGFCFTVVSKLPDNSQHQLLMM